MREDVAAVRAEGEQGFLSAAVQHIGVTDMQNEMLEHVEGACLCCLPFGLILPQQGQGNVSQGREALGRRAANASRAVAVQHRFAVGFSDFPCL